MLCGDYRRLCLVLPSGGHLYRGIRSRDGKRGAVCISERKGRYQLLSVRDRARELQKPHSLQNRVDDAEPQSDGRRHYSGGFRREAGSYGKDVRGLNRLHEFSKIEIVRIDTPEHSAESHKEMLEHVEGLLKKLELPYRILRLCGGDQSFTSAVCYDFEVYSEAQHRWLEVSSVSNFDTYQANRLKCRYRNSETKKTELCHTLNGSALALPRIVASILENFQTEDGIRLPKALVPYFGAEYIK